MQLKEGSVLLLCMIIMSTAFLFSFATWRVTSSMIDVVALKTQYVYRKNALGALQEYAYACLHDYKNDIIDYVTEHEQGIIAFDHWPTSESDYQAKIIFQQKGDDQLNLYCSLLSEQRTVVASSCQVMVRENEVEICQWRYET